MKYIDYSGKKIKCIYPKYSNFTENKIYDIDAKAKYQDGRPTQFYIVDDEGDFMSLESCLRTPSKFVLLD